MLLTDRVAGYKKEGKKKPLLQYYIVIAKAALWVDVRKFTQVVLSLLWKSNREVQTEYFPRMLEGRSGAEPWSFIS